MSSHSQNTVLIQKKNFISSFADVVKKSFNPHQDHFGAFVVLFFSAILQFSILSRLPLPATPDLITFWITLCIIAKPFRQGLILALVAGLVYETQTTLPIGQVLCIYLLLASIVRISRPSLSWRERKPWFVFTIGANVAMVFIETAVLVSENQLERLHFSYFAGVLLRLGTAAGMVLLLPRSILYFQQPKEDSL